jgi:hypothetical protein
MNGFKYSRSFPMSFKFSLDFKERQMEIRKPTLMTCGPTTPAHIFKINRLPPCRQQGKRKIQIFFSDYAANYAASLHKWKFYS